MAIYHCSINSISRGAGQSIVAAAAYRHACKLENSRTGEVHDYSRKQGLEASAIYTPSGVTPEWATNREQLWSAVESAEKRVNSRLGRDVVLALPSELSAEQRRELAGEMAHHLADRYGVVVDVAIHQPSRQGDQRNHHAHMLMSSRRLTPQGFGEKARELDDKERGPIEVEHIRAAWADMANRALERAGQNVQIDHRSLKAQGIDKEPTVHLGPKWTALERQGKRTRRGDRNREIKKINAIKRGVTFLDKYIYKLREKYNTIKNYDKHINEVCKSSSEYEILKERFEHARNEYARLNCSTKRFNIEELRRARLLSPLFESMTTEQRSSELGILKNELYEINKEKEDVLKEVAVFNSVVDGMGFIKRTMNARTINEQGELIDKRLQDICSRLERIECIYKACSLLDEALKIESATQNLNNIKNELASNEQYKENERRKKEEILRSVKNRLSKQENTRYRGR